MAVSFSTDLITNGFKKNSERLIQIPDDSYVLNVCYNEITDMIWIQLRDKTVHNEGFNQLSYVI